MKSTVATFFVYSGVSIGCLSLVGIALVPWFGVNGSLRIAFGVPFILFLPGYSWTWYFWRAQSLTLVERLALAPVLSIAIVPLTLLLAAKLHVPMTTVVTLLVVTIVSVTGILFAVTSQSIQKKQL